MALGLKVEVKTFTCLFQGGDLGGRPIIQMDQIPKIEVKSLA